MRLYTQNACKWQFNIYQENIIYTVQVFSITHRLQWLRLAMCNILNNITKYKLRNMKLWGTELSLSSIRGLAMTAYVNQLSGLEVKIEAVEIFHGKDVWFNSNSTCNRKDLASLWCKRKLFHVTTAQHSKTAKHSGRHGSMIDDYKWWYMMTSHDKSW